MPTASPSINASMGVVDVSSANAVTKKMPAIETPTPIIAIMSGMPAASSEPSVSSSTTKAMITPIASVGLMPGTATEKASPPQEVSPP